MQNHNIVSSADRPPFRPVPTYSRSQPVSTHRSRLGWSLVIASMANLALATVAVLAGATLIGVVACGALSIATILLVLAEVASRVGIDPVGAVSPEIDDRW